MVPFDERYRERDGGYRPPVNAAGVGDWVPIPTGQEFGSEVPPGVALLQALDARPTASLGARLQLLDRLREHADDLELGAITRARSAGESWDEIASQMGMSRPGAIQRYRRLGGIHPARDASGQH